MDLPTEYPPFAQRLRQLVTGSARAIADVLDSAMLADLQSLPPELWQQLSKCGQRAKDPEDELRIARALAFIPAAAADKETRDYLVDFDEGGIFVGLAFHLSGWRRDRLLEYMVRTHPEYAIYLLQELLAADERRRGVLNNNSSTSPPNPVNT